LNIDETLNWTFEWYRKYYGNEDMLSVTNNQINSFFNRWKNV